MSNLTASLRPSLPVEGDTLNVLGIWGTVEHVEPQDDWTWRIIVKVKNGGGFNEEMVLLMPTDYRTTDGEHCWEDIEDSHWAATTRMESMACDR